MSVHGLIVGDSISLDDRVGVAGWPTFLAIDGYFNRAAGSQGIVDYMEPNFQTWADAAQNTTRYLVLQGGANDTGDGYDASEIGTATTSIVTKAKAMGWEVVVCSITPWKGSSGWSAADQTITDEYNAWLAVQAPIQGFTHLDWYSDLEGDPDELKAEYDVGDGIHPNETGHAFMATLVDAVISTFFEGISMADAKISELPSVSTPATGDEFAVNQGGTSKKMTRAQLHALETGEHLVLPSQDDAVTPSLAFGDGDTGIYESADDELEIACAGSAQSLINGTWVIRSVATAGPGLIDETPSSSNPTVLPRRNDSDTGIGAGTSDELHLIAGGQSCVGVAETGSAPQVGFYGTTPVSQQTGVAVSAAGIHAALVALGLITA